MQFINYIYDFKEGLSYMKTEKGLMIKTIYFCITMFASGGSQMLILPYFKNHPEHFINIGINVVMLYTIVTGFGVLGRLVGGSFIINSSIQQKEICNCNICIHSCDIFKWK